MALIYIRQGLANPLKGVSIDLGLPFPGLVETLKYLLADQACSFAQLILLVLVNAFNEEINHRRLAS